MLTKYPFYAFSILPSHQAKGGSNKTFKSMQILYNQERERERERDWKRREGQSFC